MKKLKSVVAILLVASMLVSVAGCGKKKVKAYDKKEVKEILKDELDIDRDDIYTSDYGDYVRISTDYGRCDIVFKIFDDEEDAYDYFDEMYDAYEDDIDDDVFDGSDDSSYGESSGYIVYDGDSEEYGDFFNSVTYYYGGFYYCDNMIAIIYTNSEKNSAIDNVDEVLEAFDFPTP